MGKRLERTDCTINFPHPHSGEQIINLAQECARLNGRRKIFETTRPAPPVSGEADIQTKIRIKLPKVSAVDVFPSDSRTKQIIAGRPYSSITLRLIAIDPTPSESKKAFIKLVSCMEPKKERCHFLSDSFT